MNNDFLKLTMPCLECRNEKQAACSDGDFNLIIPLILLILIDNRDLFLVFALLYIIT